MTAAAPVPFASLWKGVGMSDLVPCKDPLVNITYECTLVANGMYALDRDGQPWALVSPVASPGGYHWVLLNDLLDGTAARRWEKAK